MSNLTRYDHNGLAGCFAQRRSRQTGILIGIYKARQAGLDESGGPWATVCEVHGTIINHRNLAYAQRHAADPLGWCETCREEHDHES